MMNKKGFTLIELLIVVAIIAILAAIAIPNFLAAQVRSKVSRTQSDMRTIAVGLESYYVDNNTYPWTNMGSIARSDRLKVLSTPVSYLSSVPYDVFNSDPVVGQRAYPYWDPSYVLEMAGLVDINGVAIAGDGNARFDLVPTVKARIWTRQPSWLMLSMGPDIDYEPAVSPYLFQIYDPTNGTVSNGDLMRTP